MPPKGYDTLSLNNKLLARIDQLVKDTNQKRSIILDRAISILEKQKRNK